MHSRKLSCSLAHIFVAEFPRMLLLLCGRAEKIQGNPAHFGSGYTGTIQKMDSVGCAGVPGLGRKAHANVRKYIGASEGLMPPLLFPGRRLAALPDFHPFR